MIPRLLLQIKKHFPTIGFWLGIFAVVYFWVSVSIDAYLNRSWWRFDASSFSALGDTDPISTGAAAGLAWIYNDVVIFPTAIMLMLFAAAMVMFARNRVESTGGAFFLVAGVFLFLVGVYHGCNTTYANCGTPTGYHDFVSDWFFVQADFSIFIWGFGLLLERRFSLASGFLGLAILTPLFVAAVDHPWHLSVAEVEAIAIVAIDITAFFMLFARKPARKA